MDSSSQNSGAEWEPLPAEALPRPTCAPWALAIGTTLLFWGVIASWIISLVGLIVFTWALITWINQIRHERQNR